MKRLICIALSTLSAIALAVPLVAHGAPAQSPTSKLEWRSVGPSIGGRAVAVSGVNNNPNLFYFGGVDGGIWKSTDYGNVWTNISDGKLPGDSNSIGAIAVAPSNSNIIYAGTGESDIRGNVITGDGMFKSADAGKTWQYAGLRDTHTISAVVIDPRNANVVYASSMGHVFKDNPDRGVFKSVDGGKTWRKVLFVNASTGAIDLVMDPNHPDVLYATMWQAYRVPWKLEDGGPGSGLYKSTDGGAHWTNLTHTPGFPQGVLGRIGVAVAASNPRVVYAIAQAKDGGVFRSNDGGASWKHVNNQWMLRQRAFYYMAIFVDPTNANTVYAPNVDALWVSHDGARTWAKLRPPHGDNHIVWINPHNPKILFEGNDGGATVSTDGGKTWSNERNQPTGQFYHVAIDDQFPFHIYGAQQDEGSFEGPSASTSGMIPLDEWHNVAYGESTFIAPQPGDPNITYGSGYFSIFMRYNMQTGQFQEIAPWPLYQEGAASNELRYRFAWTHPILFSPANPKELLAGAQYVMRTDDYGQNWQRLGPDLTRNDPRTEMPTGGPVDLDQTSAEVYPYVEAIAPSPLDANVIWAGSSDGLVHVTTDGGTTWQSITPPSLPQWCEITSIEASHSEKGTAYLTASRYMWDDFHPYIYKTGDYGRHWTAITSGLPSDQYVFAIRQDPQNANLLFAGTKSTVYTSFDGGARWERLSLNLPPVQVRDIAIDTRQGDVVIATHGRSFWVLDNLALLEQIAGGNRIAPGSTDVIVSSSNGARATSRADVTLYAPQQAWLTRAYGSSEFARFIPAVGQNPPFGATVFFGVPSSYNGHTPVTLSFTDTQGKLIRSFALHLRTKHRKPSPKELDNMTPAQLRAMGEEELTAISPGMNRFQWDLRYPEATEVTGFYVPIAAGGLDDSLDGPQVVPGSYSVELTYGAQSIRQSFSVALDPRMNVPAEALAARLALQLRIHDTLNTLDTSINRAIALRDRLQREIGKGSAKSGGANAVAALDNEINDLVQLDVHSSEGTLLHEPKLRSHLAYLNADIDLSYTAPTPAMYAVFDELSRRATLGEQRLTALMAEVARLK